MNAAANWGEATGNDHRWLLHIVAPVAPPHRYLIRSFPQSVDVTVFGLPEGETGGKAGAPFGPRPGPPVPPLR